MLTLKPDGMATACKAVIEWVRLPPASLNVIRREIQVKLISQASGARNRVLVERRMFVMVAPAAGIVTFECGYSAATWIPNDLVAARNSLCGSFR